MVTEEDPKIFLGKISQEALRKLKIFCENANKSTGSSHTYDGKLWFDFIFQTIDDDSIVDSFALNEFLSDKGYWGSNAWDKESANELAIEYEKISGALTHLISTSKIKKI